MSKKKGPRAGAMNAGIGGVFDLAAETSLKAARIFLENRDLPEAIRYFRKAAQLFSELGDQGQAAQSLNQLGASLIMAGQAQQALDELSEAKTLLRGEDLPGLSAAIEGNIGLAYSEMEDYKNAAKHHKIVYETSREIKDSALELNALINLADSNLRDKKYQAAQGFALVALDLAGTLQSQRTLVIINDLLGMISARRGDLKSALDYHQRSYETAQEIGDQLSQGVALANQALAWEGLTELDRAYQLMKKAQDIFIILDSPHQEKTRKDLHRIQDSRSSAP